MMNWLIQTGWLIWFLLGIFSVQPQREPMQKPVHTIEAEAACKRKESMKEILMWNDQLYEEESCGLYPLQTLPEQLSGREVREAICRFEISHHALLGGKPYEEEEARRLAESRALEAIPETVVPRWAVVTEFADVRSVPTEQALQDTADGFDFFQETGFAPGECVAVLHQTADGAWSFVRGEFYDGWIRSELLGYTDRKSALVWLKQQKRGTNCAVALEFTEICGKYVPMGCVLPLFAADGETMTVGIPQKNDSGMLVWEREKLSGSDPAFRRGYLPWTEENLQAQGERCLGVPYGWGDTGGNPDCSSTVRAIYRCFGIRLPRNASAQIEIPGISYDFGAMAPAEKRELLQKLPLGTLLYCPGHVMLLWGTDADGEPLFLHNTTRYTDPESGELRSVYSCVMTPGTIGSSGGTPYYELLTRAVCIPFLPE